MLVTAFTPGADDAAVCTFGSTGDQPSAPVITALACTRSASEPRLESSRPLATTVTAVTSATPIISADAVLAVRPGLRIALRRGSAPAAPPEPTAGRATTGAEARTGRAAEPHGRTADDGGEAAHEPGEASRIRARG